MKIVITKKDVDEFLYADPTNCPMANALKKALNITKLSFYSNSVKDLNLGEIIGYISPEFGAREYSMVKKEEIKEFVTEYTPL